MIEKVYIKSAVLYCGGTLFGKSVYHPVKLAKTMLAYMIKFFYCGPKLIAKILPVCGHCQPILDTIRKEPSGEVLVIIADCNRVNQSFF